MQIDFAFGNGDGQVTQAEVSRFTARVQSFGPVNATSDFVAKVNGTAFIVGSTDFSTFAFSGLTGSVDLKTSYTLIARSQYNSQTTLVNGYNSYTVLGYSKYDSPSVNYKTTLTWPSGYEMTSNSTQNGYVNVTGYLSVTIDTLVNTGSFEQVTMTVQKSAAPSAVGGIQVPSSYAYAVISGTKILYYIVSTQKNIVLTGNGWYDPNGNPLKYTWFFGDGQRANNVTTTWTTHNYSAASFNLTVVMKVYDVAGLSNSTTFYIKTDGIAPIPDFSVTNHTIVNNMLHVNQNEALIFNGASSVITLLPPPMSE